MKVVIFIDVRPSRPKIFFKKNPQNRQIENGMWPSCTGVRAQQTHVFLLTISIQEIFGEAINALMSVPHVRDGFGSRSLTKSLLDT